MPVSLTIKNVPDDLYQRLKQAAEANHRSMNGQAIVSLDARSSNLNNRPKNGSRG